MSCMIPNDWVKVPKEDFYRWVKEVAKVNVVRTSHYDSDSYATHIGLPWPTKYGWGNEIRVERVAVIERCLNTSYDCYVNPKILKKEYRDTYANKE